MAETTVEATTDGHLAALEWASRWAARKWAVEDCRHLTRTLESDLLRAGERIVRVPTKQVRSRGLRSQRVVDRVIAQLQEREGTIVEIVREQLVRVRELDQRALELERLRLLRRRLSDVVYRTLLADEIAASSVTT